MLKEWENRKILYVHGGKRFVTPDGNIYGYDHDLLFTLKDRYQYLGSDVKFVQFGMQVNEQKICNLVNLKEKGIDIVPVKYYLTPKTYKYRKETKKIIYEAVRQCDILIIRMPSSISYIAQKAAIKYDKPYLVEVVACTWDALWHYSLLAKLYAPFAFFRCKKSIAKANYVMYVSHEFLPKRYPNSNKTCSISDVFLQDVPDEIIEKRIARLSKEKHTFVITTLAAVDVLYKGQHFVIEAVAKLKKKGYLFEYHIAGGGDQTRLKKMAERLNVKEQVVFEGMLNSYQVNELLDKTDIYVQPSLLEGLPRAVVEAMSRGCAIIGTQTGGMPELVSKDYLFKKGKVKDIMNLLTRLVDDNRLLIASSKETFMKAKAFKRDALDSRRKTFYTGFIDDNLKKMKKIFVIPAHTDLNRGDQALTWESINMIKNVIPDAEIYLIRSRGVIDDAEYQSALARKYGFKYVNRILPYPLKGNHSGIQYTKIQFIKSLFAGVKNLIVTNMLLSGFNCINRFSEKFLLGKEQRESYKLFVQADYVVVKGGGFLHSYGEQLDGYRAYFFLFDVLLAQRLGKKVFVMPNSIGPLTNKTAQKIILKALSKCELLTVRESISFNMLKSFGLQPVISPDLGFYLTSSDDDLRNYLEKCGVDFSKKRIAITMRPYRFYGCNNGMSLYQNYITEFGKLITHLSKNNYHISLVAHTLGPSNHEKDIIALYDVFNILPEETLKSVVILENANLDCHQMQKLYSYYDLLIGTRFHSVIFALNVDVPAIAIAYGGNKSYGIMQDIGITEYVISIEQISAETIISRMYEIENKRKDYMEKLKLYKDNLTVERKILGDYIKNAT